MTTEEKLKQMLGSLVDLQIKCRTGLAVGGSKTQFFCIQCGDLSRGDSPAQVRHKHKCIVAQAKDLLEEIENKDHE